MTDLATLTAADFEAVMGMAFRAGETVLSLAAVKRQAPDGRRTREPFSLTFTGPRSPLLAQGIYPLVHASLGPLDLFLVPIGMTDESFEYEAVFG